MGGDESIGVIETPLHGPAARILSMFGVLMSGPLKPTPACPRLSASINTMLGLSGAVGLSAAKYERPQMDKVRGSGCVSWFRLNYRFLSVLLTLSTALSAFLLFP